MFFVDTYFARHVFSGQRYRAPFTSFIPARVFDEHFGIEDSILEAEQAIAD